MTQRGSQFVIHATMVAAFMLLVGLPSDAWAQKKPTTKTYRLVTLDTSLGGATAMSEVYSAGGVATAHVVGWRGEFAWNWRVTGTGAVVSAPLPLPPDVDPVAPAASATAVNERRQIVGGCRRVGSDPGQPLLWKDDSSVPVYLPLPPGFTGWALPRAINEGGVIVGDLSGDLVEGGVSSHVEGLIVWLAWTDSQNRLQIDPPTWFEFPTMSTPKLNDQGGVAFQSAGVALRFQLAYRLVPDLNLQREVAEFYFTGGGALFGSDKTAGVGAINEAGDVAGDVQTANQPGRDVYVQRQNGTFLTMPVYINDRTYGTYVHGVDAVNDATSAHNVQVLGEVGTYYKKGGGLGVWNWAVWEAGGSVRLLRDIAEVPTDATYDFTSVTSFHDLNDSSWICGRIARGSNRVGVPAVLIRKP